MAVKTNYKMNGKEYFRVSASFGRDAEGKLIRKFFYGKTKKEAEQKKIDYINSRNTGILDKKLYFASTMKSWLFEVVKVGQIKATSFEKYEGLYRIYFSNCTFANMELKQITSLDIQRYYNDLYKNGIEFNKGKHKDVSSNTIKNANKLLKQFFNYCQDCNYITNNPTSGKKLSIPGNGNKITKKEAQVFTDTEIKKIIDSNEDSIIRYIALISFATGMRRGEIIALREGDVDYKNKEIKIHQSVVTAFKFDDKGNKKKTTYISSNKTYSSTRTIPLPASIIPIIRKAIILRKSNQLKMGYKISKEYEGLIFLSTEGNLINAGNLDKSWTYFLKRCDIQHKKFHALRHTYATRQFENGIQPLVVSKLLGHSNIEITLNTYTHVLKKEKQKAIDTLEILTSNK